MLSNKIIDKLNEQINCEFYSSNLYLQMSSWCDNQGLEGCAMFLANHSKEEMGHMNRLFSYVNECGSMVKLGDIKAPPTEYASVTEVFEEIYKHELFVTKLINELVEAAFSEKDFSTFNFLQWYVGEQHEEEKLFKAIIDKIKIIGADGRGLFHFDEQMKQLYAGRQLDGAGEPGFNG